MYTLNIYEMEGQVDWQNELVAQRHILEGFGALASLGCQKRRKREGKEERKEKRRKKGKRKGGGQKREKIER